jgi:DNA polymerase
VTLPALDFETFSAAGYNFNPATGKHEAPQGARSKGLPVVGTAVYTEHPTAEVLTASYDLADGQGVRRWRPGEPNPTPLFDHLARGGMLEAHNLMFEYLVWENVCVPRYGWPSLAPYVNQLRCSAAKARVASLPGALGNLAAVLGTPGKDKEGTRLMKVFSMPRDPTKKDPRRRIRPDEDPVQFEAYRAYCDQDVLAERAASEATPPMSDAETVFWLVDQEINRRGIAIDRPALRDCMSVLEQALDLYGAEFRTLTGGLDPTQLQATRGWLAAQGVQMASMDEAAIDEALARMAPHPPGGQYAARRALEIRQLIGSASVKKLYAMEHQANRNDRLQNLIIHHGARTGRPTGEGPQPLNLPREGPSLNWCACRRPFRRGHDVCPWCGADAAGARKGKWSAEAVDPVLEIMATRSLQLVEWYFGDALSCISGCLRGLFVAGPGMDLIASDYSAIEAVVIAMLAGEQWRIDAFHNGDPIYLVGASKITGRSLDEYLAYHAAHGEHHPDRQHIGKVSELACGFGGWIGSYKAFGSTEPDDVIKAQILAWRAASPAIVDLWGGQFRGLPWDRDRRPELFGYEGMAIAAIQNPGAVYDWRGVKFELRDMPHRPATGDGSPGTTIHTGVNGAAPQALIVTLLSGRELTYHSPRLYPSQRRPDELSIVYMTWNSNPKYGPMGWGPMETYGGRLTENIVQATAHDILRHAILNLRMAGYPTVLHVYDEILAEVPQGTGSLEEFERIMATMPDWAHDAGGRPWPIRAAGGWRGRRYRKG